MAYLRHTNTKTLLTSDSLMAACSVLCKCVLSQYIELVFWLPVDKTLTRTSLECEESQWKKAGQLTGHSNTRIVKSILALFEVQDQSRVCGSREVEKSPEKIVLGRAEIGGARTVGPAI